MDLFVKFLESLAASTNLMPVVIMLVMIVGWLFWSRRYWQSKALELKGEENERQENRIQDQQNMIEVLRREKHRQAPTPPKPHTPESEPDRNAS